MHDRCEQAERYAEPPDHIVGTGLVIEYASHPDAKEGSDTQTLYFLGTLGVLGG